MSIMSCDARSTAAASFLVVLLAVSGRPHAQAEFRHLSASVEMAANQTDIIVRGRVATVRSEEYPERSTNGRVLPTPATVYTVEVAEILKGAAKVKLIDGRIDVRALGYLDEPYRRLARLSYSPEPPALSIGRECILLIFSNELQMLWFKFGPEGAFEERGGAVESAEGKGPSELGKVWKGRPWRDFVNEVRERSAAAERQRTPAVTLRELQSGPLPDRLAAASRLAERPGGAVADGNVTEAVAQLIEDASRAVRDAFVAKSPHPDEELSELYSHTEGLAVVLLPRSTGAPRRRLLAALAFSIYNPDSLVSESLAAYGNEVVGYSVSLARSELVPDRWSAYDVLGKILRNDKAGRLLVRLSAAKRAMAVSALISGLRDRSASCISLAVGALEVGQVTEALPPLRELQRQLASVSQASAQTDRSDSLKREVAGAIARLEARDK